MKIKVLASTEARPEVIRAKRVAGFFYGMLSGLAFAAAAWGWDAYILSQSHAYLPWLAAGISAVVCGAVGGTIGWLTERLEKSIFGAGLWLSASLVLAWLVLAIPFQITPSVISLINPKIGSLLVYTPDVEFSLRFAIAVLWLAPLMLITGAIQIPIIESSVFAASSFGRVIPLLLGIIVMTINGIAADSLVNVYLREAITSMDKTVQFVVDNKDNPNLDKKMSKALHASSLNGVKDYVVQSRYLTISGYDKTLEEVHVLIQFEDRMADCSILYGQPSFCKLIP